MDKEHANRFLFLRLQRKLRNKARKTRNKLARLNLEKTKITPMSNSTQKFTVVIDFSYDELMSAKVNVNDNFSRIQCFIFISSFCVDNIGSNQVRKSSSSLLFC